MTDPAPAQGQLYHEDDMGLRLREKEEEITRLREEVASKRQQVVLAQSQLHSAESNINVKEREIDVCVGKCRYTSGAGVTTLRPHTGSAEPTVRASTQC